MSSDFERIAKHAFHFLEGELRFRCVESDQWHVRYESAKVFVEVQFDGMRSYELSCSVGCLDNYKDSLNMPFDLGEIIRSCGIKGENAHASFQVITPSALERCAQELATKLKEYSMDLLVAEKNAFQRVAEFRDKECAEYAMDACLRLMRERLEVAWHKKEYRVVIRLLSPLQEWLTSSEQLKLEYARKMEN